MSARLHFPPEPPRRRTIPLLAREYTDGLVHRYREDQLGDPRLTYVSPVCELDKPHPARHLREQVANAYNRGKWCSGCASIPLYIEKGTEP